MLSFDVLLTRGTVISKKIHRSRIQCAALSVITVHDHFLICVANKPVFYIANRCHHIVSLSFYFRLTSHTGVSLTSSAFDTTDSSDNICQVVISADDELIVMLVNVKISSRTLFFFLNQKTNP